MKLTDTEVSLCSYLIRTTGEVGLGGIPVARQFQSANIDELTDAVEINKKTKATLKGDKFNAADIDFTPSEVALLLKCANRPFSVDDAEIFVELKKKLEAK